MSGFFYARVDSFTLDRLFINSSHSLICCFLSKLHQSPLTFNYKETGWLSCNKALFFLVDMLLF